MKVFSFQYIAKGKAYREKIAAPSKVLAVREFFQGAVIKHITNLNIIRIC